MNQFLKLKKKHGESQKKEIMNTKPNQWEKIQNINQVKNWVLKWLIKLTNF